MERGWRDGVRARETGVLWRGHAVDQVQLHLRSTGGAFFSPGETSKSNPHADGSSLPGTSLIGNADEGTAYRVMTVCFDRNGNMVSRA